MVPQRFQWRGALILPNIIEQFVKVASFVTGDRNHAIGFCSIEPLELLAIIGATVKTDAISRRDHEPSGDQLVLQLLSITRIASRQPDNLQTSSAELSECGRRKIGNTTVDIDQHGERFLRAARNECWLRHINIPDKDNRGARASTASFFRVIDRKLSKSSSLNRYPCHRSLGFPIRHWQRLQTRNNGQCGLPIPSVNDEWWRRQCWRWHNGRFGNC